MHQPTLGRHRPLLLVDLQVSLKLARTGRVVRGGAAGHTVRKQADFPRQNKKYHRHPQKTPPTSPADTQGGNNSDNNCAASTAQPHRQRHHDHHHYRYQRKHQHLRQRYRHQHHNTKNRRRRHLTCSGQVFGRRVRVLGNLHAGTRQELQRLSSSRPPGPDGSLHQADRQRRVAVAASWWCGEGQQRHTRLKGLLSCMVDFQ